MKTRSTKTFFMYFFFLIAMLSCSKDSVQYYLQLILTHSDAHSFDVATANVTFELLIDGKFLEEDSQLISSPSRTEFTMLADEGYNATQNIGEGETRVANYNFNATSEAIDLKLIVNGGSKEVNLYDITPNDNVIEWDFADGFATVSSSSGSGDDPSGGGEDGEEDCSGWYYHTTQCLSGVADGNGSSEAGMRSRVCRLSETETQITVRTEIEAINGGIDDINYYEGIQIFYGDDTTVEMSKESFNSQVLVTREFTVDKTDGKGWEDLTSSYFIVIWCTHNN